MSKRDYFLIVAVLVLIFVIASWAYLNGKKDRTDGSATSQSVDQTIPSASGEEKMAVGIVIEDFKFTPNDLKIKKGTVVTWTNKDGARHTVTGKAAGPASALFGKSESYSYVFNETGTFDYYCVPHPYMKGLVEVTE